jgi:glycerol dehydrogenase-like iron-containing ADH family enzyme
VRCRCRAGGLGVGGGQAIDVAKYLTCGQAAGHRRRRRDQGAGERGIRALAAALEWGGSAFGYDGWTPRHIEGSEHLLFYALEAVTGRKFIHGQAVALRRLPQTVVEGNLWYTIASDRVVTDAFIGAVKDWLQSGGQFDRSVLRAPG